MKILLNNREEIFSNSTITVSEMLDIKKYSFRLRVVKLNGKHVPEEEYDSTIIHDGDSVQMLYLMSGG